MNVIRPGDQGEAVRDVQRRLTELGYRIGRPELDGTFGPETGFAVREFQGDRSLPIDGVVGPDTWTQLVEAGYRLGDRTLYLRVPAFRGDDVRELQRALNALGFDAGKEDGIFGASTGEAVKEFQRNVADRADGIVGLDTVHTLARMRPTLDGPSRAVVREEEAVRSMRSSLSGSTIAVDAAHAPAAGAAPSREAQLTLALADALAGELERRGASAVLLRPEGEDPTPSERAQAANAASATACLSVLLPDEGGVEGGGRSAACSYWGSASTHSPAGRLLAELIQGRLVRLGLADGGLRPLTISLLRETRMPAVQVEVRPRPGAPGDIGDERFIRQVAGAIADGIDAFFRTDR